MAARKLRAVLSLFSGGAQERQQYDRERIDQPQALRRANMQRCEPDAEAEILCVAETALDLFHAYSLSWFPRWSEFDGFPPMLHRISIRAKQIDADRRNHQHYTGADQGGLVRPGHLEHRPSSGRPDRGAQSEDHEEISVNLPEHPLSKIPAG
jgi:hypothetical protein